MNLFAVTHPFKTSLLNKFLFVFIFYSADPQPLNRSVIEMHPCLHEYNCFLICILLNFLGDS